jgi:copper oxidase (laccase) domain-containing protein
VNTLTSQNNISFKISDKMKIGIYPYPSVEETNLKVLDLARAGDLVEIHDGNESLENIDAAVCFNKSFSIGMRTRDCAPVCFSDGEKIATAHIGWQGFSLGLLEKTLAYFDSKNVVIYVGPFLNSFEIKRDFCYDALIKKLGGEKHMREENGKLIFEFQKAIAEILPEQTIFDTRDTFSDMTLPSNRRDKDSKGFLTTVSFV